MLPADLTILILLVSGLVFAIIELGLSAYIVSAADSYISYVGYGVVPGWLAFLLFASLWTVIRTLFRLVRLVRRAKPSYDASGRPSTQKWVPILTLVINAITMIFWLSGFAAYATWLSGFAPIGIYGALLAFAVMLWLVFLALLIVNILTATGAWKSDNVDYAVLKNGAGAGGVEKNQATGGGSVQEHPVAASEVQ